MKDFDRDYHIDNIKCVLIFLVILGHYAMKVSASPTLLSVKEWIYGFHMTAFIVVSGYLAGRSRKRGKLRIDKILSFLWLYVFFQLASAGVWRLFGGDFHPSMRNASSAPWYLLSMASWYALIPLFEGLRKKTRVLVAVLLGLLAGYIPWINHVWSLSRSLVFLPAFFIGFSMSRDTVKQISRQYWLKLPAMLVIVVSGGIFLFCRSWVEPFMNLFYGVFPYEEIRGITDLSFAWLSRLLWYVYSLAITFSLLILTPTRKSFVTVVGERTLQIYILHILVRNALVKLGYFAWLNGMMGRLAFANLLLLLIGLLFLLSAKPLEKLFRFLSLEWLFKKLIGNLGK